MTETVVVRRLAVDDLELWKHIRLTAIQTAPRAFGRTLAGFQAQNDADHIRRLTGSTLFGAFSGGQIIGSAGWYQVDFATEDHRGKINSVFVVPAFRGTGVAEMLIKAIVTEAKTKVVQLELTVTAGQERAVAFYRRMGFEIVGTIPRGLCHDGVYSHEHIMVHRLDA
jgi:ribosomal protein S18 acetylase RimI-like enzyme